MSDPLLPESPAEAFTLSIVEDGHRVLIGVRGDLDQVTAPALEAVIDSTIEHRVASLALDLSGLTFFGAAGLRVIAGASSRLADADLELALVSPPPMTRRLLALFDLDRAVRDGPPASAGRNLGASHLSGDHSVAVIAPSARLGAGLGPSSTVVLDAALGLVTALVNATMTGADGASVSLQRNGRMTTVASSDETVRRMDEHQYLTGEGPCLTAADEGDWIHIESLSDEARWPEFVPLAMEEGIASILSTPLLAADRPLGALNIYSNTARAFGPDQQGLAALFASQVSGILAEVPVDLADERTQAIQEALHDRALIARAQGVLMAREHLSEIEASARLHRSARAGRVSVAHLAADVVTSVRRDPTSVRRAVDDG